MIGRKYGIVLTVKLRCLHLVNSEHVRYLSHDDNSRPECQFESKANKVEEEEVCYKIEFMQSKKKSKSSSKLDSLGRYNTQTGYLTWSC